jgi:hypothetical protein
VAAALVTLALAGGVGAEPWGGLMPGESTLREVEQRFGRPNRERAVTEEGRTTPEWTYLADRSPRGIERMVVSFGVLRGGTFVPDVVRAIVVYPNERAFPLEAIAAGWGTPDAIGTDERTGQHALRWDKRGLLIMLDPSQKWAQMMLFAPAPAGTP